MKRILQGIGIILIILYISLHIPAFQNYIVHSAVDKIESKISGKIEFSKFSMTLFNRIIVEDLLITGTPGDTLARGEKIAIYVSLPHLLHKEIRVNRVNIHNGAFNFISEGKNGASNLKRIFNISSKKDDTKGAWPYLTIKEIRISDFDFRYHSYKKPTHPVKNGCMDYTDIVVKDINLRIHDTKTRPKKGITAKIDYLQAKEKSGLELQNLSCDFSLDKDATTLKNLTLIDKYTNLKANHLIFSYDSGKDLQDFVNKIKMDADFVNTHFCFKTIGYFTHTMQNNSLELILNGRVTGPVANLSSNLLNVSTKDQKTAIELNFLMKGLPDITTTHFDAEIKELNSSAQEIDKIITEFSNNDKQILTPLISDASVILATKVKGELKNFTAEGELLSSIGDVSYDINGAIGDKDKGINIGGNITADKLNLGRILKSESLGLLSSNIGADILIKEKEYGGLSFILDSLTISQLGFNGYNYKNLFAIGEYSNNQFDGKILCHDPNLHLMFQGVATISDISDNSIFDFYADIPFIDLTALNLIKSENQSQLSLRTRAKIAKTNNNILGSIGISNITYWGEKEHNFGAISLSSVLQDHNYIIDLKAPFIEANYKSTESPTLVIDRLTKLLIYDRFPSTFIAKQNKESKGDDFSKGDASLHIKTFHTEEICDILMPDLYISDNSTIDISLSREDSLSINLKSDRLALGENSLKGLRINVSNPDSLLKMDISGDNLTASNIELNKSRITLSAIDEIIQMGVTFDNSSENTSMELLSDISFSRGGKNDGDKSDKGDKLITDIKFKESFVNIKGYRWILPPSSISLGAKDFRFNQFRIEKDGQYIDINGAISENIDDSIKVRLHNFDLSFIDAFLKNSINLSGTLSGNIGASTLYKTPSILMDLKGDELSLMERSFGTLQVLSKWDQNNKRMNLLVMNQNEGLNPLTLSGFYDPEVKYVNLNLKFKEFGLAILEPFLKTTLKDVGGVISGDLELSGPLNNLSLLGENTIIHNFAFTPVFTNVPYVISGPVDFRRDGITLNHLKVLDKYNNTATLNGVLRHNSFKNFYLDASLSFQNLQCLNTYDTGTEAFYGTAFASGLINLTGPFNDLFADVTVSTGPQTAIHIPLSSSASAKKEDLLSFKSRESIVVDPYLERIQKRLKKKQENSKSKFTLQAKASVTSDAELFIEINKQLGDILKCRGNGVIDVDVDPTRGNLDLKGDYTIDEGSYKFVLLGITAKDFIIDNGGSINFNGDVKNTTLNVGATYQTKASISTLISDTSAVGNRRNVDCGIRMSGSLSDPNISFSIDVQDLDPITKGRVESALSTDDKIQKQFMALLISGSFVPDEQSGIVNNTTILYSNAGEMLSNQFNNVFRQLDIPLDLGLNFQPASDGKTHDIFDVALSYQAFNNRVIINGNVGNNQASQNWGGDFEAEIKIDKKGKMRLKAFTRSADDYSNYLDNTQRHGVGFTYQDEFDSFRELLRNIFWSRKRKEEYETKLILEAEKAIMEEEKANTLKKEVQKAKESPF